MQAFFCLGSPTPTFPRHALTPLPVPLGGATQHLNLTRDPSWRPSSSFCASFASFSSFSLICPGRTQDNPFGWCFSSSSHTHLGCNGMRICCVQFCTLPIQYAQWNKLILTFMQTLVQHWNITVIKFFWICIFLLSLHYSTEQNDYDPQHLCMRPPLHVGSFATCVKSLSTAYDTFIIKPGPWDQIKLFPHRMAE